MPSADHTPGDRAAAEAADPLGEAVAAFLTDLLDNVSVEVVGDTDGGIGARDLLPEQPVRGADGRMRQFRLSSPVGAAELRGPMESRVPEELADLPAAALRALQRMTRAASIQDEVHPSLSRTLHDVVVGEVLADRLAGRLDGAHHGRWPLGEWRYVRVFVVAPGPHPSSRAENVAPASARDLPLAAFTWTRTSGRSGTTRRSSGSPSRRDDASRPRRPPAVRHGGTHIHTS